MSELQKFKEELLMNPEVRTEYESMESEYQVMRAVIKARLEQNMTQQELAEKSGVRQSNISRIESGACTPTIPTLLAIADGLGKKLVISFE